MKFLEAHKASFFPQEKPFNAVGHSSFIPSLSVALSISVSQVFLDNSYVEGMELPSCSFLEQLCWNSRCWSQPSSWVLKWWWSWTNITMKKKKRSNYNITKICPQHLLKNNWLFPSLPIDSYALIWGMVYVTIIIYIYIYIKLYNNYNLNLETKLFCSFSLQSELYF